MATEEQSKTLGIAGNVQLHWRRAHESREDRCWVLEANPEAPNADVLSCTVTRFLGVEDYYTATGHQTAGYQAEVTELGTPAKLSTAKRLCEAWLRDYIAAGVSVG